MASLIRRTPALKAGTFRTAIASIGKFEDVAGAPKISSAAGEDSGTSAFVSQDLNRSSKVVFQEIKQIILENRDFAKYSGSYVR